MPYNSKTKELTAESVQLVFKYNPETGHLYRILIDGSLKKVGTPARGTGDGHLVVGFNRDQYRVTTIIWLIMTGKFPEKGIDHKNRAPYDNRWENLREANQSQNMANSAASKRSKSGVKGVFWDKERNKWATYITLNYKTRLIGRFDTIEKAKAAYDARAKEYWGEFARS